MLRNQLRKLVAEWLREAMAAQAPRVTGVDLAEKSGISRPTISDILNEKTDAEDGTLEVLARALHYPLPELAARSVAEPQPAPYRVPVRGLAGGKSAAADSAPTPESGRRPSEREIFVGVVRDALVGAVDRALARDHELEQTKRGYRILGDAFLDLGLALQDNDVDTSELLRVARELQKRGAR